MGSLIYSAVGTANALGAAYKKLDVTKLDPGMLMRTSDPAPSHGTAQAEAKLPLAQELRAQLLEAMGLSEDDLPKMRSETRSDLEDQIARQVHREVLSRPDAGAGAFVDVKA